MGFAAVVNFPSPDFDHPNEDIHRRQLADATRGLRDGKVNSAIDITLELAPATETIVEDSRVSNTSRIVLTGGNSAGIADMQSGTVRVVDNDIVPGQFRIQHLPFSLERRLRAVVLA